MKKKYDASFNISVKDQGGYFQVYHEHSNGTIIKIGNIRPPGYVHFRDQIPVDSWVAEHDVYGEVKWQNMERALAFLISPRGMT